MLAAVVAVSTVVVTSAFWPDWATWNYQAPADHVMLHWYTNATANTTAGRVTGWSNGSCIFRRNVGPEHITRLATAKTNRMEPFLRTGEMVTSAGSICGASAHHFKDCSRGIRQMGLGMQIGHVLDHVGYKCNLTFSGAVNMKRSIPFPDPEQVFNRILYHALRHTNSWDVPKNVNKITATGTAVSWPRAASIVHSMIAYQEAIWVAVLERVESEWTAVHFILPSPVAPPPGTVATAPAVIPSPPQIPAPLVQGNAAGRGAGVVPAAQPPPPELGKRPPGEMMPLGEAAAPHPAAAHPRPVEQMPVDEGPPAAGEQMLLGAGGGDAPRRPAAGSTTPASAGGGAAPPAPELEKVPPGGLPGSGATIGAEEDAGPGAPAAVEHMPVDQGPPAAGEQMLLGAGGGDAPRRPGGGDAPPAEWATPADAGAEEPPAAAPPAAAPPAAAPPAAAPPAAPPPAAAEWATPADAEESWFSASAALSCFCAFISICYLAYPRYKAGKTAGHHLDLYNIGTVLQVDSPREELVHFNGWRAEVLAHEARAGRNGMLCDLGTETRILYHDDVRLDIAQNVDSAQTRQRYVTRCILAPIVVRFVGAKGKIFVFWRVPADAENAPMLGVSCDNRQLPHFRRLKAGMYPTGEYFVDLQEPLDGDRYPGIVLTQERATRIFVELSALADAAGVPHNLQTRPNLLLEPSKATSCEDASDLFQRCDVQIRQQQQQQPAVGSSGGDGRLLAAHQPDFRHIPTAAGAAGPLAAGDVMPLGAAAAPQPDAAQPPAPGEGMLLGELAPAAGPLAAVEQMPLDEGLPAAGTHEGDSGEEGGPDAAAAVAWQPPKEVCDTAAHPEPTAPGGGRGSRGSGAPPS